MSDMHAMTRVLNGQRVPSIVVHKVTGERLLRAPIDCRELIAGGEWEWLSDDASKLSAPDSDPTKLNDASAAIAAAEHFKSPDAPAEPVAAKPAPKAEPKSYGRGKGK